MLKKIRIKGCFTHQDSTFEFQEGMTAITGLNGSGKSLIMEMVQFSYFGISALRGISDDYKSLEVEHECWIKGKPYTIKRTISKAVLFEGHGDAVTQIASGTKAVNQAVRELFGYSQAVFQVANAVNQKQVDKFCEMLPTARKKLVDETIGLSALDELVKWIGVQETSLKASINARASLLAEPMAPVCPDAYVPSSELEPKLRVLQDLRLKRDVIAAKANEVVFIPGEVKLEEDDAKHAEYKAESAAYSALVVEAQVLQRDMSALPAFEVNNTQLEEDDVKLEEYRERKNARGAAAGRLGAYEQELSSMPPDTPYSLEQLNAFDAQALLLDRWIKKRDLIDKGVNYHCSECGHDGHMHDPRVESEFADVPDEMPQRPEVGDTFPHRRRLELRPRRLLLQKEIQKEQDFLNANPDKSDRIRAIEAARKAVADNEQALRTKQRHDELMAKRADLNLRLVGLKDRSGDVVRIENTRIASYLAEELRLRALEQQKKVDEAKAELATFPPTLDGDISRLEALKSQAVVYETNLRSYDTAKVAYDAEMVKQAELQSELEDWNKGKLAIADLRTKVKGYLLPSLNKVASYLVNEFTGGVIPWLVINEDFEVIVGGKRVETLSGGGKTAANLAIRIGLGQVLTNAVFPVLMLDEPDESCDDSRAEFIEKTLAVLKEKMKQIILVTHKTGRAADHRIHLEA